MTDFIFELTLNISWNFLAYEDEHQIMHKHNNSYIEFLMMPLRGTKSLI